MNNYNDTYRGIVIQNNDPENAGRVKVYVPEVNAALIKNWSDNEKREIIAHMGANTGTTITPALMQRLRTMLPWARVSLPVFGMSTPAFYEASTNTSFKGNDSGLESQKSNKSPQFFKKDKQDEQNRKGKPLSPDPFAKAPRQTITDITIQSNNQCFPYSCGSPNNGNGGGSFPSIWLSYRANSCLNEKIRQLPRTYDICDSVFSDVPPSPVTDFEVEDNTTILSARLDIVNPQITIDNNNIELKNTIFGTNCFEIEDSDRLLYSPPITFEEDTGQPPSNYSNIPINFIINGNDKISDTFFLQKIEPDSYRYISGKTVLTVAAANIRNVALVTNGKETNMSKLTKLIPMVLAGLGFIQNLSNVVMPRGTSGGPMMSRGGGGGSLYNRVNSPLLPAKMRRNALIGGNNPVSRETTNQGRKPSFSLPNQPGANQQGSIDTKGPYRPSDQGNNFKGMISIPSPGSHVSVRFEQGNINRPIVESTFAGRSDYANIAGVHP